MANEEQNEGVQLKCQRCDYAWLYKGTNPYYTSCPYCKTTVGVKQSGNGSTTTTTTNGDSTQHVSSNNNNKGKRKVTSS